MSLSNESIRILFVEDVPTDAELAQREIKRVLNSAIFQRVETQEDFLTALETFQPDLIISDYRMPHFDGLTALRLAQERTPLTPVIILTGAINEDTAVECMKAGATDYVIKEHIKRLGQAVLHAMKEKQLRQERHRAEAALRESEERYRTMVQTLPDAITITDLTGNITYLSPLTVHFYGHQTQAEVLGHNILEWVHVSQHSQALNGIQTVLAGGFIQNQEYLLLKKDGSTLFGEVSAAGLKDGNGQMIGVIILVRDISERKRAEYALRESEKRFRLTFHTSPDAINITRLEDGLYVDVNEGFTRLTGFTREDVIGQSSLAVNIWVDPADRQKLVKGLKEKGYYENLEARFQRKDGTTMYGLMSARVIPLQGTPHIISITRDITERKQAEEARLKLEEQLRQAQKMESVGRLAGGIAHDFNNLLTVIQGHSMLMRDQMPAGHPLLEPLEAIQHASERAAALTRQLLAFSRKQILAPSRLDLNYVVTNLRKMLERLIGEDISLSAVLQPGLWSITADVGQLEQVIVNLAVNARDAMPTGGLLTIETKNIYVDGPQAAAHPDIPAGPYALLSVTDTGIGMDEHIRAHLFEPFFTTKEVGKGTGLGLATVYGIIKQSGGDISVYSEPEQGTTFKIYLPAQPTNSATGVSVKAQPVSRGGSETILLVEDDKTVRNLVRETLQNKGYTILEAHQGGEALSLAGQYQGQLDLLLTDVVMPQMSGRQLAEWLKIIHPEIKVLFMSGYTDDAVVRHGLLAAEVEFLPKPFLPSALIAKVREVLDK